MLKFKGFRFFGHSPLTVVELFIAVSSLVAGVYIASPLIVYSAAVNGASSLVTTLGNPLALIIFGGIYACAGILGLIGIFRRKYRIRSAALLAQIACKTFTLLGVFIVQGFLPLNWLSSFFLILITVVCYLVVRGFIHRGLE